MAKTLTHEIIHAAIAGFEAQKKTIDAQITELRGILKGESPKANVESATPAGKKGKKKRKLSAAGRKAIADAAKKRWALINAEKAKAAKK